MLELLPPRSSKPYYVPQDRRSVVRFRLQDLGHRRRTEPVFEASKKRSPKRTSKTLVSKSFCKVSRSIVGKICYQVVVDLAVV